MDYQLILQQALPVVAEAAAFIASHAGHVTDKDVESKSLNSLVSFVDKNAEKILVAGLRSILPDAGFVTEEETVAQKKSTWTWIIDPLDGTTNFLQQIPFYSVSVGLLHDGELVVGIVSDVVHQEVYTAWKSGGAWCNGTRIHVSSRQTLQDAVVATGFPYTADKVKPELVSVFDYFLKNAKGMRRLGSAALDLAYVACGRFDLYYETSLNAWDIAGGILIVTEAGGKVADFKDGQTMLESGDLIASNEEVFSEGFAVIHSHFHP